MKIGWGWSWSWTVLSATFFSYDGWNWILGLYLIGVEPTSIILFGKVCHGFSVWTLYVENANAKKVHTQTLIHSLSLSLVFQTHTTLSLALSLSHNHKQTHTLLFTSTPTSIQCITRPVCNRFHGLWTKQCVKWIVNKIWLRQTCRYPLTGPQNGWK